LAVLVALFVDAGSTSLPRPSPLGHDSAHARCETRGSRSARDPGEGKRIADDAARRLADAYGDRLREVVLFGSWVRGQAHEESDVDLVVVLDHGRNRASERERIVDALLIWRPIPGVRLKPSQWPRPMYESGVGPLSAALDEGLPVGGTSPVPLESRVARALLPPRPRPSNGSRGDYSPREMCEVAPR
jgi:Nucleotidyltransferase domain